MEVICDMGPPMRTGVAADILPACAIERAVDSPQPNAAGVMNKFDNIDCDFHPGCINPTVGCFRLAETATGIWRSLEPLIFPLE
jgi:hypothetical protein